MSAPIIKFVHQMYSIKTAIKVHLRSSLQIWQEKEEGNHVEAYMKGEVELSVFVCCIERQKRLSSHILRHLSNALQM